MHKKKRDENNDTDTFKKVPVQFLMQHLENPITVFDHANQKFVYANPQFHQLIGVKSPQYDDIENAFISSIHPQDLSLMQNDVQKRISNICKHYITDEQRQLTYTLTFRLKNGEGRYKSIMIQTSVLEWKENGDRSFCLNIYFDIDKQKKDCKVQLAVNVYDIHSQEWESVYSEEYLNKPEMLSRREIEIMVLIIKDKSATEISKSTAISYFTIRAHWRNILMKTECKTVAELKEIAIREGWI